MKKNKNSLTPGETAYLALTLLFFSCLVLGLSGDWLWPEGWIFTLWFIGIDAYVITYLGRQDPALLKERLRKPGTGGQEDWDKVMTPLILIACLGWFAVMPLDAKRFHWFAAFPRWVEGLGFLGLVPATYFIVRSYFDNSFASPLVRIQKERGQKVVSTGVYGIVRHPMYLGGILMVLAVPLLLNSKAGLAVGALFSLLICLRILGEENALLKGLKGYAAYRKKVRYRLLPGVW